VPVPRSNAGTSPRVVLSSGGGDDGRALAVGSTRCRSAAFDRARGRRKPWRGRGGDRASTRGNGCGGGPRTPCGARTRCRYAVARKARTGLPWVSRPGGLGTTWGEGLPRLSPTGRRPPRKGSIGIRGAWSLEGRARAKRIHGGGDSPPGSRRPSRPLPASREGGWPPNGHSPGGHGLSVAARSGLLGQPQPSPGWEMGRGARGSPRDGHRRNRGEAPRPLARGVGAAAKGARGPSGRGISGPQGCPYPEGPTLTPPAHRRGVSALWGATFAKVPFCAGVTLLQPRRPPKALSEGPQDHASALP
jgi:hypothetical protein